jgi:hypothetical protein
MNQHSGTVNHHTNSRTCLCLCVSWHQRSQQVPFAHLIEHFVGNKRHASRVVTNLRHRFGENEEAGGFTWEEGASSDETPSLAGDGGDCEAAGGELALQLLQPRRHSSPRRENQKFPFSNISRRALFCWMLRWAGTTKRFLNYSPTRPMLRTVFLYPFPRGPLCEFFFFFLHFKFCGFLSVPEKKIGAAGQNICSPSQKKRIDPIYSSNNITKTLSGGSAGGVHHSFL